MTEAVADLTRDARRRLDKGEALALLECMIAPPRPLYASAERPEAPPVPEGVPLCPLCNVPMNKRVARKGANAGKPFWGCSRYPHCRQVMEVAD